ncbi:MAG TPA: DUF6600 domain-containing protein [Rhodanobacteraceae bacterium]|nr:DUF6600 domain-containing protein [Rhodanobacteraceae bacterium]
MISIASAKSAISRYANSVSRRYVAEDVVGYDDLDQYGDWQNTSDYGEVWYPTRVSADWAPYRDGHWAWIEPWGWTWVDDEPWGYAPFHYGRWAYVRNRWGWVPGPRTVVPVYSPALVAFVGGSGFSVSVSIGGSSGQPVGWFPLGPRDVYVPPYRASRNYFTSINVTNIRNVYVNKTVINNYYGSYAAGRRYTGGREYAYRNNPRAFTAVPRNVFAGARPVRSAVLHVKPGALAKATVASMPHVAPTRASLAIRPPKRPIARPVAKAFDRTVVARHAPPPRPAPFAAREKVIAKQGGAPIPVAKLRQMRQQHAKSQPERVHVLAAAPKPGARAPAPNRAGKAPVNAPRGRAPIVQAPHAGERAPQRPTNRAPRQPASPPPSAAANQQKAPLRPGELRSARFAHPPHGRAEAQQQRAGQERQNAQSQATQAQQNRKEAEQQQRAGQERQNAQSQAAQAQQNRKNAEQARQQAEQVRQNGEHARVRQEQQHAKDVQAQARQAQQRANQERAQHAQQQAKQAQARQRDEQERARQQKQQAEQQRTRHEQQQQQQRAHEQQQERARQEQQQARQAQQQQRAQQVRAQQQHAQQQRAHQQQRPRHAPPPPKKQEHKKKDHDKQDNGH